MDNIALFKYSLENKEKMFDSKIKKEKLVISKNPQTKNKYVPCLV